MSTISLRVSEKELELFRNYAMLNNRTLSEMIRETVVERIEDEFDKSIFEEYEREMESNGVKTYSHEDAWKEVGL